MAAHPIVVRTFQSNSNRHTWHWSLNQGITKVNNIHPLGSMNVQNEHEQNFMAIDSIVVEILEQSDGQTCQHSSY